MYRNNREQATSKYIDYFKINIRRNINIHRLSPGREGKQNHRLPHIGARLRMERHDTRTCASFRASRRENKTRRRDFNGTNGHGNFAHRESDEERFEKLGRLLLTNEASLIENCLKLPLLITITRVATVVSNSIRESYNVIDTQNDFLYRVKRKLAQQIKYQLETVDRFARRFALACPPF